MFRYVPPPGVACVANLKHPDGGEALLWEDGGVWVFDAPFNGSAFQKPYFAGRKAARLELREGAAGTNADPWYRIRASSGEPYGDGGY